MVKLHTANHRFMSLLVATVLSAGVFGVSSAQNDDAAIANYKSLLDKRLALQTQIGHLELQVAQQEEIIADLEAEVAGVPALRASVRPLVEKMVASYAAEFEIDPPFNASERFERLSRLQENLELNTASDHQMLNRAIGMYEKEVNYGMTVDQYAGNHPLEEAEGRRGEGWRAKACQESLKNEACNVTNEMREAIKEKTGKELEDLDEDNERDAANLKLLTEKFEQERKFLDGNYLRVGRLALIYADVDGEEVFRYDVTTRRQVGEPEAGGEAAPDGRVQEWIPVEGAQRINLYRAVKMAKGEAAPDVMAIPVLVE